MNRKIGDFCKYKSFVGTIEISDVGNLTGVVVGSVPPYEYFAKNIESLEIAFHQSVDEYMLNSLYYKDIKCSSNLISSCSLNCESCICRDCDERETCIDANNPCGCGS